MGTTRLHTGDSLLAVARELFMADLKQLMIVAAKTERAYLREGNPIGVLEARYLLLLGYCRQSELKKAFGIASLCLREALADADDYRCARSYLAMGAVAQQAGECWDAVEFFEQGLTFARKLSSPTQEFKALTNLAMVFDDLNDTKRALHCQRQADRLAGQVDGTVLWTCVEINRCHYLVRWVETLNADQSAGYWKAVRKSERAIAQARVKFRASGELYAEICLLDSLLRLYLHCGKLAEAQAIIPEFARIAHSTHEAQVRARFRLVAGKVALANGDLRRAEQRLRLAADYFVAHEVRNHALESLQDLERAYFQRNQFAQAYAALSKAFRLQEILKTEQTRRRGMMMKLRLEVDALRRHNETLALEAETDGLTGVVNRRSLESTLNRLATGFSGAVLMIDMDHFKMINDQLGHPVGDEVLRQVARILKAGVRECDIVARYGGEEFAVVLHGDRAHASEAADRLRATIEAHPWRFVHPDLRVTASVGLATVEPGQDIRAAILVADPRLYAAKAEGRNCVHAA